MMKKDNNCSVCGIKIESYDDPIIDYNGKNRYLFHSLNCYNIYKKLKIIYGNSFNMKFDNIN
jgi:hypothetical protein